MAKVSFDKEYRLLQDKVEAYTLAVQRVLDKFTDEVTALAVSSGYTGKKYFRIDDYPETKKAFDKLQRKCANDIRHVVVNGCTALWEDSNFTNNKFAQSILGNKAKLEQYAVYFNNNSDALNSFLKRQRNGLNLSQRIWRIEEGMKEGLEAAITVAMQEGKSAAQLSRDIRNYLKEPDKLFRRVAMYDEKGDFKKWRLSQPALKYNPGEGMYRSSYKNAMRLASSEINMAYRSADRLRWEQMDFIVGYEVKRSNHPYTCDICKSLKGVYPKDFVFTGWHPWCRCYVTPVLKTEEEMARDDERILSGKEPLKSSVNKVRSVPDNFKEWVNENKERIHKAQERETLPFFLRDNPYSKYIK